MLWIRLVGLSLLMPTLAVCSTCQSTNAQPDETQGADHSETLEPPLSEAQQARLDALRRAAQENPNNAARWEDLGLALMWTTLAGHVSLQAEAENALELSFARQPQNDDRNRAHGRFYNMRTVSNDFSKADEQVAVYQALIRDRTPDELNHYEFVAWTFMKMGEVLVHQNNGAIFPALGVIGEIETEIAQRIQNDPDNVELHALGGNFAVFFAGNVPVGKQARVAQAQTYFTRVREDWNLMRPGSTDPYHCPNTYENFMFTLAEVHTVQQDLDAARVIYAELAEPRQPATRTREMVAAVSQDRLDNLDAYAGDMQLMPPWPSDWGNCIVCHAYNAKIPTESLHSLGPVDFSRVGAALAPKPASRSSFAQQVQADQAAEPAPVVAPVEEILRQTCLACHLPPGEGSPSLNMADAAEIERHARWIAHSVETGRMPLEGSLTQAEVDTIVAWAQSLQDEG